MPGELIPVLIVFIVVGIPIICGTLLKLAKLLIGDDGSGRGLRARNKSKADLDEETRLIQEMHQSLSRLGSLETIVLQNERKR
tara:strand:+ start:300 stop:548 length:249 start_codon:yes stop_codon:yes gene_type:complete